MVHLLTALLPATQLVHFLGRRAAGVDGFGVGRVADVDEADLVVLFVERAE